MNIESLYQGLTFLAWTSVGFIIIVGIMLAKVLFDFSRLIKTINQTANIIKQGSEPIIKDLTEATSILTAMVKRTNKGVTCLKNIFDNSSKYLIAGLLRTSKFTGVIIKWIISLIKIFTKSK